MKADSWAIAIGLVAVALMGLAFILPVNYTVAVMGGLSFVLAGLSYALWVSDESASRREDNGAS